MLRRAKVFVLKDDRVVVRGDRDREEVGGADSSLDLTNGQTRAAGEMGDVETAMIVGSEGV